ncbi:glutathione S-transferase family protein [Synechococcus sp. PCC 6312]|uniref:glutathione S-transferase family protein n=1 Tax=Synechococcus sp. (strain ATCC 27167 / PCC 6312) TaxID=195253 RepID=UPI00029F2D6E|nr:glutathione S-transferase family protein [Synechococcus sp. PCC 6312]AFY60244.1 glutathione S-transferase [Synechococcus sp. PCC 6312]
MIQLYGGRQTRAAIVHWYLEELGIPYEFVVMDMKAGAHKQADFLAINPMGKVPALVDGNLKLWESGAILLYLADSQGKMPEDAGLRGLIYQWVLFANSSLPQAMTGEAKETQLPKLLAAVDGALLGNEFLVADTFTVADVAMASTLSYAEMLFQIDFSPYSAVQSYLGGMTQRPAFRKGIMGQD